MPQLAADDFNRANGALGANWTTVSGLTAPVIASNQAQGVGTTSTGAVFTGAAWTGGTDQYAECAVTGKPATADYGPDVRSLTGADTKYTGDIDFNNTTTLGNSMTFEGYKFVAGTPTKIINGTTETINVNDVIRIEAQGTRVEIFRNGVSKGSITDGALSAGGPGFHAWNIPTLDNFAAGNFAAPGVPVIEPSYALFPKVIMRM